MERGHGPIFDQFADEAGRQFAFLVTDFGLQASALRTRDRFAMYYAGPKVLVVVELMAYETAVCVHIGDPQTHGADRRATVPLWAIAELRGSTRSLIVGDPLEQLSLHAHALRAYARDILHGDFTSFPEVRTLMEARLSQLHEEQQRKDRERMLSQATTAYHAEDYEAVVALLKPLSDSLSVYQQKLLRYSLKQVGQSGGTGHPGASPVPG